MSATTKAPKLVSLSPTEAHEKVEECEREVERIKALEDEGYDIAKSLVEAEEALAEARSRERAAQRLALKQAEEQIREKVSKLEATAPKECQDALAAVRDEALSVVGGLRRLFTEVLPNYEQTRARNRNRARNLRVNDNPDTVLRTGPDSLQWGTGAAKPVDAAMLLKAVLGLATDGMRESPFHERGWAAMDLKDALERHARFLQESS